MAGMRMSPSQRRLHQPGHQLPLALGLVIQGRRHHDHATLARPRLDRAKQLAAEVVGQVLHEYADRGGALTPTQVAGGQVVLVTRAVPRHRGPAARQLRRDARLAVDHARHGLERDVRQRRNVLHRRAPPGFGPVAATPVWIHMTTMSQISTLCLTSHSTYGAQSLLTTLSSELPDRPGRRAVGKEQMSQHTWRRPLAVAVAGLTATLGLVACGDDSAGR